MRVVVVTPPGPVVSWEEADHHLKLDGDVSQQEEVEAMIAAATAHIDGPAGWLGRAIGEQTLQAFFDGFCDLRALPYPPVIEVEEVRIVGADGVTAPISSAGWVLRGDTIAPVYETDWPATRAEPEAVRVTYRAGYPVVPAPIRAAILLMTADLYRNRGESVIGTISAKAAMTPTVEALLAPFRVYR